MNSNIAPFRTGEDLIAPFCSIDMAPDPLFDGGLLDLDFSTVLHLF